MQEKGEIFLQKGFIKKIISSNTVQQVQCAYIKLPTRHTLAYSVHIINVSKNIKSVFTQIISIKKCIIQVNKASLSIRQLRYSA